MNHQIAQNLSSSKKQLASFLISSFKWNDTQKNILSEIAPAFGKKVATNGEQKEIISIIVLVLEKKI